MRKPLRRLVHPNDRVKEEEANTSVPPLDVALFECGSGFEEESTAANPSPDKSPEDDRMPHALSDFKSSSDVALTTRAAYVASRASSTCAAPTTSAGPPVPAASSVSAASTTSETSTSSASEEPGVDLGCRDTAVSLNITASFAGEFDALTLCGTPELRDSFGITPSTPSSSAAACFPVSTVPITCVSSRTPARSGKRASTTPSASTASPGSVKSSLKKEKAKQLSAAAEEDGVDEVMQNVSRNPGVRQSANPSNSPVKLAVTFKGLSPKRVGCRQPRSSPSSPMAPEQSARDLETFSRRLLKELYNENLQDSNGQTPLIRASSRGHIDQMSLLLDKGAFLELQDNLGCTALNVALNSTVVKYLLQLEVDVDHQTITGESPIFNSCESDDVESLQILIAAKANLYIKCKQGNSVLHKACASGSLLCTKLLLDHGLAINERNNRGSCPLHLAAENDHFEVMKLLINLGADITLTDSEGRTILELGEAARSQVKEYLQLRVGDVVGSPLGNGRIKAINSDGMLAIEPINWVLANNKRPTFYMLTHSLTPYDPMDAPHYTPAPQNIQIKIDEDPTVCCLS